jgi:hypothetical protein
MLLLRGSDGILYLALLGYFQNLLREPAHQQQNPETEAEEHRDRERVIVIEGILNA